MRLSDLTPVEELPGYYWFGNSANHQIISEKNFQRANAEFALTGIIGTFSRYCETYDPSEYQVEMDEDDPLTQEMGNNYVPVDGFLPLMTDENHEMSVPMDEDEFDDIAADMARQLNSQNTRDSIEDPRFE